MTAILSLLFMRQDVCEAERPYNHPVEFAMPDTATVEDLVLFLADYREPQYRALPGTAGTGCLLSYDEGTLARVCPDPLQISYANIDQHTPLKELRITRIYAVPAEQPAQKLLYTPYTVPNPRTTDGKAFVADPDHLLSAEERNAIQEAAEQLHTLTGVEMVTVALDDIGEADAFDFAYDLFNEWGIGDSETNTGVLLFFTMQQHDIRITTGKGLEGLLPDGACYYIIADDIIPLLRHGQYGAGLLAGNQAVTQRLTTRQALEELLLGYRPKEPKEQPWKGLSLFALFVAMIAGLAYRAAPRCPQCKKKGARTKDEILVYATYTATGRGIHHHTCRSCGHRWDEPYTIAKRTRSTSSYGRGGGYSSGGSSGGSFGGGSTSGGGAGGKW